MSDTKIVENAEKLRQFCKNIYIVPIVTGRTKIQKIPLLFQLKELRRFWERLKMFLVGIPYGNIVFYHPVFRDTLKAVLNAEHYDIVQFEVIVTGQYILFLKNILKDNKTIFVQQGMIAEELKRMAKYSKGITKGWHTLQAFLSERFEKETLKKFDHVISMSDVDKTILLRYGLDAGKVTVIRSGVDIDEFPARELPGTNNCMVTLGSLKYLPNKDGLNWFLDNVLPIIRKHIQDITVLVIGEKEESVVRKYSDNFIIFKGIVDKLETEMGMGMIFIAPIRIGTGTRLKIVTAMSLGMPVVATSVAIEGINARETEGVIIADTEENFAEAIIDLYKDKEKRFLLGANARTFVEREYSWENISYQLDNLYRTLLN
jgi:glycosyltransferase involved in cell wall biosynthesis